MKESGRAVNTNGPCKQWFRTFYLTTVADESHFFFLSLVSDATTRKKHHWQLHCAQMINFMEYERKGDVRET